MRENERGPRRIERGEAVFLPPAESVWAMRQAGKRALRDGLAQRAFLVKREELCFPGVLDQALQEPEALDEYAGQMAGETDGAIHCVALWDTRRMDGLLFHRESGGLLAACLPAITRETVVLERDIARRLALLARRARNTPILLERAIPSGQWLLGELLDVLCSRMNEDGPAANFPNP